MSNIVRVRVPLVIEVDRDKWDDGRVSPDARTAELVDDVRSYVLTAVQGLALIDEADATVAVGR
jgi:hypothetical protein